MTMHHNAYGMIGTGPETGTVEPHFPGSLPDVDAVVAAGALDAGGRGPR
jgi:hypothetical protein